MIHRGHAGIVNEHIQPPVVFSDLGEHFFHRRFVDNIEAIMAVIRELIFKEGPAAPQDLTTSAYIVLD